MKFLELFLMRNVLMYMLVHVSDLDFSLYHLFLSESFLFMCLFTSVFVSLQQNRNSTRSGALSCLLCIPVSTNIHGTQWIGLINIFDMDKYILTVVCYFPQCFYSCSDLLLHPLSPSPYSSHVFPPPYYQNSIVPQYKCNFLIFMYQDMLSVRKVENLILYFRGIFKNFIGSPTFIWRQRCVLHSTSISWYASLSCAIEIYISVCVFFTYICIIYIGLYLVYIVLCIYSIYSTIIYNLYVQ